MVALVVRHASGAEALRASLRTQRLRRNEGYRLLRLARAYPPVPLQLGMQSRRNQSGQLGGPRQVLGSCFKRLEDASGTFFAATDAIGNTNSCEAVSGEL